MYIATIYDPSVEGIQGEHVIHSNLDTLKTIIETHISNNGQDTSSFTWDSRNTYYPELYDSYGEFTWARIQTIEEGQVQTFTEFNI